MPVRDNGQADAPVRVSGPPRETSKISSNCPNSDLPGAPRQGPPSDPRPDPPKVQAPAIDRQRYRATVSEIARRIVLAFAPEIDLGPATSISTGRRSTSRSTTAIVVGTTARLVLGGGEVMVVGRTATRITMAGVMATTARATGGGGRLPVR
ncbi:MAG: hypothetical protein ACC645_22430 [Pirellulales bacterium]